MEQGTKRDTKINGKFSGGRVSGVLFVSVLLALSLGSASAVLAQVRSDMRQPGGGMSEGALSGLPDGAHPGSHMHMRALREELRRGDSVREEGRQDRGGDVSNRCGGPCRMSSEERQQLRRDIHEAGRDIYPHGPRRGGPPRALNDQGER